MSPARVLVVDDEPLVRSSLARALDGHGYDVGVAKDGGEALAILAEAPADVVLLDLVMPGIDGFEVLRRLLDRSVAPVIPVIVVSARGDEADKIAALDLGADDYLTKPFGVGELLARLRVVRRRVAERAGSVVVAGDVVIDLERRVVTRGGEPVHLAPIELAVLAALAERPGVAVAHQRLVEAAWSDPGVEPDDQVRRLQSLRVHVTALRRKLEPDPQSPTLILTVPGTGYRLWAGG